MIGPAGTEGSRSVAPDAAPAIEARGLTRAFAGVPAVEDLSFDVHGGELFGLVGPDGAGKTTTLRMLAGVLRPSGGDALVLGASVARDPEAMKPRIAYMPQRFGLYGDLTVRENLDFYADLHGLRKGAEREARIERLYRFSALEPFAGRLAGKLSGGMKQKLALSCALIHRPRLLLLDEPTFGVDPISRRDLWIILQEMLAEGITILLSTSYLDEAERCDRVALLDGGKIVALDAPRALQAGLEGRAFEIRAASPRAALRTLRERPETRRVALFGESVHVTLREPASRLPAEVLRAVESAGTGVESVEALRPSLEDVFLELTGG
ncbi:MAG TPA: ABC transporter ATP-binding protein [Gemmatimonadota bacterium]|jgi:ABC-2 type transport system ATP-binding protein|nr:ABC transporter ATP-binding protein [Gemmatimonadota bacterium]